MKPRTFAQALLLIALTSAATVAQQAADEPPAVPADATTTDAAAAAAAADPAQPGPHHEHLQRLAGNWQYTMRVWLTPDTEPVEAVGTAEARLVLGGRFVRTIYRGELFGQAYEGWSIDGYDNQAKEYVGTWRDTQGTYTLIYRGSCANDGSVRTMTAKMKDPASGSSFTIRSITTFESDERFVYESSLVLSEDATFKNMELVATRRGEG